MIYRRIVILFLLFIVFSGRGQTNSVINGGEDVATRSLILSRPDVGWFGIWDTVSGEETSSFVFSLRDGEAIRNLDVFHNEAVAYALAFEGYAWGIAPSNSRLIKLDLHTAEQTVVLEQRNIWEYLLSPDKQHAWVIYDPPDVSRYHVSFNPSLGCVLNLETGECTGDYELWPMDRMAFFWIDSQNLLILERQSLFILNITDFEKKELPDLPQVHSMFFVRDLSWAFISSEDFPGMLMRLDLRTGEREFVNIIDDDTVYTVVSLSPSHDMIVLSWVRCINYRSADRGDILYRCLRSASVASLYEGTPDVIRNEASGELEPANGRPGAFPLDYNQGYIPGHQPRSGDNLYDYEIVTDAIMSWSFGYFTDDEYGRFRNRQVIAVLDYIINCLAVNA